MNSVIEQAKQEIAQEDRRQAVDDLKLKLRSAKWWHKIIPFKIIIIRRQENGRAN